jgi:hypothetical protein
MIAKKRKANLMKKLASQLAQDLKVAFSLSDTILEFTEDVNQQSGELDPNVYAVALSLQHYYTSLETPFKRVAKELDGDLPSGEQWHLELLEQLAIEIKGLRPALLNNQEKKKLDKIRRFIHVVRHGYEYELDWYQIKPLVELVNEINPSLENSFKKFEDFLISLAEEIE